MWLGGDGSARWYERDGGGVFRASRFASLNRRFTQEDPIGLAGGVNLYGFADGDPVNFSDPFGLCPPCGPWQIWGGPIRGALKDLARPIKGVVGTVNIARGVAGVASGVTVATGGSVTGVGVVVGTAQAALGVARVSRGTQQLSEAMSGDNDPSFKNLLGLAPFGQMYDDINEPGPVEWSKSKWEDFVDRPVSALIQALKEFFAIERK